MKESLGCQCPDEVFNKIEVAYFIEAGDIPLLARIVIGGRLLIYLTGIDNRSRPDTFLETLIREGRDERDSGGLNRFRLVIVSEDQAANRILIDTFDAGKANDEKIHLHILSPNDPRLKELLPLGNE